MKHYKDDCSLNERLLSTKHFQGVAAESVAEQAKHIHSQKFHSGNSTNVIRQPSNDNKGSFQKSSTSRSNTENEQSADIICCGCGGYHGRSYCKFRDVICRFCKKPAGVVSPKISRILPKKVLFPLPLHG
ncbi:hypothetical protein AVEN_237805-1 [Araneus ventricosus]|uniref:Uncharacterized protein n=1 Tax=Araneus ventricosus TaxID=182803 RepID=A0A4Y2N8P9_ARAVE|nr:hypothetical protein AVEN_237805-1 [Araneus ventricosus]